MTVNTVNVLFEKLKKAFSSFWLEGQVTHDQITLEIPVQHLYSTCETLKTNPDFRFEMLMDLCGVDYLEYGISNWATSETTFEGFSRGVATELKVHPWQKPRFAVVYQLLSITHNHRVRIRTFPEGEAYSTGKPLVVPSVYSIWNSANWYEREAFDLFGIMFDGHPDMRRLLTDYGFIGHPFRKDFPLIGTVEMRYSAKEERVIYEPVSIEPRTLVPKTIPEDSRYE